MTYTTNWLRIEALGVLLAALGAYAITGGSWLVFIGLLLAPDRALGYGLKYPDGFQHTHLGRIGRAAASAVEAQPASSSTRGP